MFTVLLGSLLAAQGPVQLASAGFNAVKVPRALATSLEETFALRLSQGAIRVTTQKDVATVLGVERQKQLLGCADDATSCLAELAGALGSEGIIRGEVTQVGRVLQVVVRVLTPSGQVVYSGLRRVKSNEAALGAIDELADEAHRVLTEKLRPPASEPQAVVAPIERAPTVSEAVAVPVAPARTAPWVVVGVGAGLAALGLIAQVLAIVDYNQLADLSRPVSDATTLRERGKVEQAIGLSLLAAGGLTTVVGIVWAALDAPVGASAWLSTTGGGVTLSGAWP